jgi:hypothetical protein
MRTIASLACVSLLTLVSACATPSDGYYDANGNYVPYNRYNQVAHDHSPLPGGTNTYANNGYAPAYSYDRAGYYDHNGYYIAMDGGLNVPQGMFPPRGMCRVWFADRVNDQPPVESCNGIQSRVPAGAYVIYGG